MKCLSIFCVFLFILSIYTSPINAQNTVQNLSNSHIAYVLAEKDLLPESIAYDSKNGDFYVGSTRKGKIVKIAKDGTMSDFILSKEAGLWMVIGLKIDAKRNLLWVCSSGGNNLEGYALKEETDGRPAGIFKFNLKTGKLIKKYVLDRPDEVHFFNDIVLKKNGDVYITHMFKEHAIYKISAKKDALELAFSSPTIQYPNGLTLSKDESKLYVAHAEGIALIQLPSGKTSALDIPEGLKITRRESIDGLYYVNNTLVGIQPDIKTVQQFHLNPTGTAITKSTLLEVNHPMMNNPTTGEMVEGELYYIANAQFGSFDENGKLFPMEKLYEPVILKTKIQSK